MAKTKSPFEALRDFALGYPETTEDMPWGHTAIKVKGKIFLVLHLDAETLRVSTKLPHSHVLALHLPFCKPTGYGLGKSGWISASFAPGEDVPVAVLKKWTDESYRAIASKKLVASLDGTPPTRPAVPKKAATKKPT